MIRIGIYILIISLLYIIEHIVAEKEVFVVYSILPLIIAIAEGKDIYKKEGKSVFWNITLLCNVFLFCISFGITNALFLIEDGGSEMFDLRILIGDNYLQVLNDTMFWINVGLISMWGGFHFFSANKKQTSTNHRNENFLNSFLTGNYSIRWNYVNIFFAASILTKLYLIKLGMFGYTTNMDNLIANVALMQILSNLSDISHFVLVVYLVNYFLNKDRLFETGVVFFAEFFFGFISGYKFQVMFPFVALLICEFIVNGNIKFLKIGLLVFSVVIAYNVIEPFRAKFSSSTDLNKTYSISEIIEVYDQATVKEFLEEDELPVLQMFLYRNNLTGVAAKAFHFQQLKQEPLYRLKYSERFLLLPFMAYLPRALWATKPLNNLGMVYNQDVLGASELNTTSVSPSLFGYIVLGLNSRFIIIPILFVIGILQAFVTSIYRYRTLQAILLFLIIFNKFVLIDEVSSTLTFTLRELPLSILLVFLICKRISFPRSNS